MVKITYIGAGSAVFARQVLTDVLAVDGLDSGEFALVDIDEARLANAKRLVDVLVARSGKPFRVTAFLDRREALPDSDYVVNSIEVNGAPNVAFDYEIPLRYGVDQCIGDTIGPGGIFKMLRTGPTWLDIVRDVEQLCPRALLINYTNPMSALTLAALRTSAVEVIGLCHSVQHTSKQIAGYLDIPLREMVFECAGINHNSWFTRLEHNGQDLYPRLRQAAANPDIYALDPVRFETMLHLGAFVTESSGHFSEYVPYFRSRPDRLAQYAGKGFLGESGFYAHNWPQWRVANEAQIQGMADGSVPIPAGRSNEYASAIIEGIELDRKTVVYGNVRNTGLISNLPDGCVEVATLVDRRGLQPTHFGRLPEQLASLNRTHMAVHELLVDAVTKRDRQAALYALMIDPLTAAVCSLRDIEAMFSEMWDAQRPYLETYA